MLLTSNYGLKKPEESDPVDVQDFNDNADIIDKELQKRPEFSGNASNMTVEFTAATQLTELTSKDSLKGLFAKCATAIKELIGHITKNATASVLGHVKLSSSTSVTDSTGLALPATEKNADINGTLANQISKKAPTSHASTGTTYGIGNASNYGHVKLSDVYTSLVGAAANAIGASQSALYNAYKTLNDKFTKYLPLAGGTVTGTLILSKTTDSSGTADNRPALIVGGVPTAVHIEIDNNEIQGKANGTTVSELMINKDGGNVNIGDSENNYTTTIKNDLLAKKDVDINGEVLIWGSVSTEGNVKLQKSGAGIYGAITVDSGTMDVKLLSINSSNNIHMGDYTGLNASPVYLHAKGVQYNFTDVGFAPEASNAQKLGTASKLWSTVYAKTGSINTSDRTKKHDINDLTEVYEKLFLMLQPKSFVFNDGDRVHIGAISQDVEEAMQKLGIEPEKFAGFCKDIRYEYTEYNEEDGTPVESSKVPCKDEDGNIIYDYALRYQEFIFLTIHMVQKLWARTEVLENENREIKEQLQSMQQDIAELKKVSA